MTGTTDRGDVARFVPRPWFGAEFTCSGCKSQVWSAAHYGPATLCAERACWADATGSTKRPEGGVSA